MAEDELTTKPENEMDNEKTGSNILNIHAELEKLDIDDGTLKIPKWLEDIECPFNWLPVRFPDVPSNEVITKISETPVMDEGLNDSFPYEVFVRILTLVFELSCQGEESQAWANLKFCEEFLGKEKLKYKDTFSNISEALSHAFQGTKSHLLLRTGKEEEAKQIVASLQPVREMSVRGLAAVQGMRARFFYHYRKEGARLAVHHARQALALDPDSPLWLILTSQSIRRLRKFQHSLEEVSEEEVKLLEQAVGINRSPHHLLLLAQAYREAGDCLFKKHRNQQDFFHSKTFHEISEMQAKAFDLYRETLSLRPDSEVANRLCGYGLLKLPAFKSDYRLAERCLQKALEQDSTNATTIHALGLYYYKGLMDYEKAVLFCEKAGKLGNFPASLDVLRMKRLVYGNNYDPVFDFQKLLRQYGDDKTKKHEILCQMGSYYLFFERNLCKALKYFKTLKNENAELAIMTSHKCTFLNMACKINLYQCIVNDGLQVLQEKKLNLSKEEKSLKEVEDFLNDLKVTNPELFEIPINADLINDLHKISNDIKQTYIRKKERRDGVKERRRGSLTSWRSSLYNDISITVSRRQSESSLSFRRNSGNIETFQNRSLKKVNDPISNQQSLKNNKVDDINKRRYNFQTLNGHHFDLEKKGFRRRSSGDIRYLGHQQLVTSPNNPKYNVVQIPEPEKEIQGTKKQQNLKTDGIVRSNKKRMARKGNTESIYKRSISWADNLVQENKNNMHVKVEKE